MIPDVNSMAYDFTVKTNLVQATVMAVLEPLTGHNGQRVLPRGKVLYLASPPAYYTPLEKRIAQLEQREILAEADLALLRGQLDRVSLATR